MKENAQVSRISLADLHRKESVREIDRMGVREGKVPVLTFPLLEKENWLSCGFTTRLGGVSEGGLSELNLSYTREKNRANVDTNFRLLAESAGFKPEDMVLSFQTHTTNIRVVTASDRGKGFSRERDYSDIDGLVTNIPGLVLITFYGDCVPLMVADPEHHAVGCAHSGWKGTLNNIGKELVRMMEKEYGSEPQKLLAAIGPSICADCFEVDQDVAEAFRRKIPADQFSKICRPSADPEKKAQGKHHINLQEACRQNFLAQGLLPEHISIPDLCTCCNPDLLFSHRGSMGEHGLMAGFMRIIPQ